MRPQLWRLTRPVSRALTGTKPLRGCVRVAATATMDIDDLMKETFAGILVDAKLERSVVIQVHVWQRLSVHPVPPHALSWRCGSQMQDECAFAAPWAVPAPVRNSAGRVQDAKLCGIVEVAATVHRRPQILTPFVPAWLDFPDAQPAGIHACTS